MNLTEEQKEHFREADRQNGIVRLTWQLFSMFLSEGKPPAESLRLAREAMEVWQEFDDEYWMEPPDIEPPNIFEQMVPVFEKLAPLLTQIAQQRQPWPWAPFVPSVVPPRAPGSLDAEFYPDPAAPDPVSPDPTGTTQTKEGTAT